MILWYVQFLKSKMINIELFSVGSRGEFYLNITSYVSCILRHFVLFCWLRNSPLSNKDRVIYTFCSSGIEHIIESFSLARSDKLGAVFTCPKTHFTCPGQSDNVNVEPWHIAQTIQSLSVYDKELLYLNFLTKIFQKSSSITRIYKTVIHA
jgi:hypothetical protein